MIRVTHDVVVGHEATLPLSIPESRKMGAAPVFDPEEVAAMCDHFASAVSTKAAGQIKMVRGFARDEDSVHCREAGRGQAGVCTLCCLSKD